MYNVCVKWGKQTQKTVHPKHKTLEGVVWYMFSNNNFYFFKQYYMYFYTFFHPYVFPHMFLNNNFQFFSVCVFACKCLSSFLKKKKSFGVQNEKVLDLILNSYLGSCGYLLKT